MTLAAGFVFWLVPLTYGLLFLASGVSKWLRRRSVAHTVRNYGLLPRALVDPVANLLAPTETLAGVLMVSSVWFPVYPIAWALTAGLLTVFTAAVGAALARGLRIPCGCGWLLSDHVISWTTLSRNLLLLALLGLDLAARQIGWLRP